MHLVWILSVLGPVLLAHILIDFNIGTVKGIPSIFVAARDPIFFTGLDIGVIRLEALSREGVKCLALVVNGLSAYGEGNPSDSGRSSQTVLIFNPHDSGVFHIIFCRMSGVWGRRTLCAVPSNALFDAIFILVGLLIGLRYLYGLWR